VTVLKQILLSSEITVAGIVLFPAMIAEICIGRCASVDH
jgi:hypothetical protein